MTFFERLERETSAERNALYSTPQIVAGLAGRISRETYVAYLGEAYHHVRHTVPLLGLARDQMDPAHARFRLALEDYIQEETGHEAWILNDIASAGGDVGAVRAGPPGEPAARLVAFARDYVSRVNPMGMFGMIYVLEGTSIALATHGAKAVAAALGLGPECFSYLRSHGALDQAHMKLFAALMGTVDDPRDQTAIIEVARQVFGLYADLFRSIPHTEALSHAI
jgi:heme oxygenase